jgi:hypothetical protein
MEILSPTARPSSPAPTADLAGKHLCINHFRTGLCRGSSCRGIHLPDGARHSALREAAVKPAASDRVFSLDDVRKVVRQELFSAHRGRGRRGNGSERRRAGKQEYWVAEKKRRRVQASHGLARRRSSMLFRIASQPALDVTALISVWRSRVRLSSLFSRWKFASAQSVRSAALSRGVVLERATLPAPETICQPEEARQPSANQKRLNLLSRGPPRKNARTGKISYGDYYCSFCGDFWGRGMEEYKVMEAHESSCVANPLVVVGDAPKKRHTRSSGAPPEWCA